MADDSPPSPVTEILTAIDRGDGSRSDELLMLVYEELRGIARRQMAQERPDLTLQPTALVHEAYLRLVGGGEVRWEGRGHFFAAAAEAMRRILVERARRQAAARHGGGRRRVPLEASEPHATDAPVDVLALDEALGRLEARDRRMADIVKLRFFAGLTIEETGRALGVTARTVNRDWLAARAWLRREVEAGAGGERGP